MACMNACVSVSAHTCVYSHTSRRCARAGKGWGAGRGVPQEPTGTGQSGWAHQITGSEAGIPAVQGGTFPSASPEQPRMKQLPVPTLGRAWFPSSGHARLALPRCSLLCPRSSCVPSPHHQSAAGSTHQLENVLILGHDGQLQGVFTAETGQGSVLAEPTGPGEWGPPPTSSAQGAGPGAHLFWIRAMTWE